MAQARPAQLIRDLRELEVRQPRADDDVHGRIDRVSAVDVRHRRHRAVDDAEFIVAERKSDPVTHREMQRLGISGSRNCAHRQFRTSDELRRFQAGANLCIDCVHLRVCLSEADRHRMFVAGFIRIAPYVGVEEMFRAMLQEDAAAVDEAFRVEWERRCKELIPHG
ncbi:hypothetical protein [Tardiphaga sp.]|uniref:hypothetical protein n=1 Tax=Tardiphaga sp. TaxID=1926292 RepID=UPI0026296882|nr:hypothetical protein [Tardiphaga sp.]